MDVDPILFKKLVFIYNCLNRGWSVSKQGEIFTLTKKHNNNRKYYKKKFLRMFVQKNLENFC